MNDNELTDLYFARSEEAVEKTQEMYGTACRATAARILRDMSDAEECENDVYLHLWNSIPPTRPDNFRAYLLRTARNLAINRLAASHAQKRDVALEVIDEYAECRPDDSPTPEETVIAQESREELRRALNAFLAAQPKETRIIFVRRYWYFCEVEEIASSLGMKEGSVKSILFRTRRKLKEFLVQKGIR